MTIGSTGMSADGLVAAVVSPPPTKLVEISDMGRWYAIRSFCHCGCRRVVLAVMGATLKSALHRFRFARREAELVDDFMKEDRT